MSNKLSPLFNSTSALLEFQIWSDATSHAIPVNSCATTGKNQFELVTASLNDVLPMRNGSTPWPPLKPLIFPPDDLYRKNTWLRTMCCLQNSNPLHTPPFWLNIVLDVPKLKITQTHIPHTYTSQIIFFVLCTFSVRVNNPWPNAICFVLKVQNCHLVSLIVLVPQ